MADLNGKLKRIYDTTVKTCALNEADAENILIPAIKEFSAADPSGTNKYVPVMVKIFCNEKYEKKEIISMVRQFHSIEHKLSPKIFENQDITTVCVSSDICHSPKDIQRYNDYKDLEYVYQMANEYTSKRETSNKIVDEETDVVYDADDYLIVVPLTFESSCYWGVDTKWCTTSKESPKYFADYSNSGSLFYIIDKYRVNEKSHPLSKFAIHIKQGYDIHDGELFNRPDISMGRGVEKMLPERLFKILYEYHVNGRIVDLNSIRNKFVEYKKQLLTVPFIDDEWTRGDNVNNDETIVFGSDLFPSYHCHIRFVIRETGGGQKEAEMSIIWKKVIVNKNISASPTKGIGLRELNRKIKRTNGFNEFNQMISSILSNSDVYTNAKIKILDDVIISTTTLLFEEWKFTFTRKKLSKHGELQVFGGGQQRSITDLGVYSFSVQGPVGDLNQYSANAVLDFVRNEFVLMAGETDELSWEHHRKDFTLLYYTELGIFDLCCDFKNWVIDILTNKTDKVMTDLYGDQVLKVISKSDAFDEYLKCSPDDAKIKFKPGEKSKQFFHRASKNCNSHRVPLRPKEKLGDDWDWGLPSVPKPLDKDQLEALFGAWDNGSTPNINPYYARGLEDPNLPNIPTANDCPF